MLLHASTILARTPAAILSYLSHLPKDLTSQTLLFSLSTNTPASSLSSLVSSLTTLTSHQSIGCLSSPLPALATWGHIACSLAFFDRKTCVPFRSDIRGRTESQVGRWHAMRNKEGAAQEMEVEKHLTGKVDWEDVWSRSVGENDLPLELQSLRPQDVHTVITLTDNAPQGLTNALNAFPRATKLGLIATSTPFITGRPFTLMHNQAIYSSGAVGLALTSRVRPSVDTAFPGLRALTPSVRVTRSEANLVHELDHGNPSQLLLSAIQKHGIDNEAAKEDEFYLFVLRQNGRVQVHRIMSGDPTRGTMALESDAAPAEGTLVQVTPDDNPHILVLVSDSTIRKLCHRSKHAPIKLPSSFLTPSSAADEIPPRIIAFMTSASDSLTDHSTPTEGPEDVQVYPNVFLASSENGFILSRFEDDFAEATWKCTVAGGVARLEL
ncbi:hypothetical protein EW146_g1907 [Bondarzewia mesenterica]|uniref:FIST domain-containing protein n=1 Tax=Bondarzewia mesenterica TaxID=1095465 RepID=A0A4V3XFX3_9AGAM|nr:hypothetical protein EW146_g1907 [Bondarzewia mesenterica]